MIAVLAATVILIPSPPIAEYALDESRPAFSSCRAYSWDITGVPKRERARMRAAFEAARQATGLDLRPVRRAADITISFTWVKGQGRSRAQGGQMAMSFQINRDLRPGLRRTMYLHELGHVLGLADVWNHSAVMNAFAIKPHRRYAASDLMGLYAARQTWGGCW